MNVLILISTTWKMTTGLSMYKMFHFIKKEALDPRAVSEAFRALTCCDGTQILRSSAFRVSSQLCEQGLNAVLALAKHDQQVVE